MSRTDRGTSGWPIAVALVALLGGCADMKDQARFEPLEASAFFADGRASRPLVEGTVPRGHLREDDRFYRGVEADGSFVKRIPATVDAAMLARGRERYDIFCAPCHSQIGDGMGMIVQRGYKQPSSYHTDRLRAIEDGYVYDVITSGFNQMSSYAAQVRPEDRWAIVAYVRALQLSQFSARGSAPSGAQRALEHAETYDPRPAAGEEEQHGSAH